MLRSADLRYYGQAFEVRVDAPAGPFSLTRLFDRAERAGRLHGLRLDGVWMHVGTPAAIAEAEAALVAWAM